MDSQLAVVTVVICKGKADEKVGRKEQQQQLYMPSMEV